jgi:hypothetical protein
MQHLAVKLDADGDVLDVIVVEDHIPEGYQKVSVPIGIGQNLADVEREELAKQVRTERDRLLSASDWTQVADAPVDQAAWAEYRQALRDVPEQEGFPENVVWPTKPE